MADSLFANMYSRIYVLMLCEGLGTNVAICVDQHGSPLLAQLVFHSSNSLVRCLRQDVLVNAVA